MEEFFKSVILKHSVEPVESVTINSNFMLIVKFVKDNRTVSGKIDTSLRLWTLCIQNLDSITRDDDDDKTKMYIKESNKYYKFLGFKNFDKAIMVNEFGDKFLIEFSWIQ